MGKSNLLALVAEMGIVKEEEEDSTEVFRVKLLVHEALSYSLCGLQLLMCTA
jgi:hypothetical protein